MLPLVHDTMRLRSQLISVSYAPEQIEIATREWAIGKQFRFVRCIPVGPKIYRLSADDYNSATWN